MNTGDTGREQADQQKVRGTTEEYKQTKLKRGYWTGEQEVEGDNMMQEDIIVYSSCFLFFKKKSDQA